MNEQGNLRKFFLYDVSLKEGIVPFDPQTHNVSISSALANLPEEESRKMKRKFRKLWRKARKNLLSEKSLAQLHLVGDEEFIAHYYGKPGMVPSREQLARRKNLVAADVRKKVQELVKALTNGLLYLYQRMPYNLLVILWVCGPMKVRIHHKQYIIAGDRRHGPIPVTSQAGISVG
jgi:hypothetical protein